MKRLRHATWFVPGLALFAVAMILTVLILNKAPFFAPANPDDALIAQWLREEVQPNMAARAYLRAGCVAQTMFDNHGASMTPLDEQACYNSSVAQRPVKEFIEWKAERE
jgi:hypothetical protein